MRQKPSIPQKEMYLKTRFPQIFQFISILFFFLQPLFFLRNTEIMRFNRCSLLAVPALVSADAMSDLLNDFTTISATNTDAFNQWVLSYAQIAETYFHSVFLQVGICVTLDASFASSLRAAISSITANYDYSDYYAQIHSLGDLNDFGDDNTDSSFASFTSSDSGLASELAAASLIIEAEESSLSQASSSENSISETESGIISSGTPRNTGSPSKSLESTSTLGSATGSAIASSTSVNSSGMGSGQAPMLIGAALAGISILWL